MNKKGLSPLVATLLLVVFALAIGTITMTFGKSYTTGAEDDTLSEQPIVIANDAIGTDPLKALQLEYIQGKISQEEYLQRQKELTG